MSASSENWYVYYPAPAATASALPALRRMLGALAAGSHVHTRLEESVGRGSTPTWMEVYEGIHDPTAFEAELAAAVRSLPQELTTARRVERFRCL